MPGKTGRGRGRGKGKTTCGTCRGCRGKAKCEARAMPEATPKQTELEWGLDPGAEYQDCGAFGAEQLHYWLAEEGETG